MYFGMLPHTIQFFIKKAAVTCVTCNITLQIPQICSQIKKISEIFSQNKNNKLTEKNFLVSSARI